MADGVGQEVQQLRWRVRLVSTMTSNSLSLER
jgi:hypothetical protein